MIKRFIFLLTCVLTLQAVDVDLRWIEAEDTQAINTIEAIFIQAFTKAYQNIPLEVMGIDNLQDFLKEAFDEEKEALLNHEIACIVAEKDNTIVGLATCKELEHNRLYLSQMAVDPAYWRQHIAKNMIVGMLEQFPDIKEIVYLTRRINTNMLAFSKALGATECNANDIQHQAYLDPKKYIAFKIKTEQLKPIIENDTILFAFFGVITYKSGK